MPAKFKNSSIFYKNSYSEPPKTMCFTHEEVKFIEKFYSFLLVGPHLNVKGKGGKSRPNLGIQRF